MLARRLSIRSYLAIVAAGFLALCAAAIALPHDPYLRWQSLRGTMFESTSYFYERLHFDPKPVDVVVIGSSRAQVGVSPPLLETMLAQRGRPLHVLNMSLPAAGMDIRLVEAREALRAHPEIRLLVIPVVEALPREGHQAFASLATVEDVVKSPVLVNRNLAKTWFALPMRQMMLFAKTAAPAAFGVNLRFDPARYPGSSIGYKAMPGWQPQVPAHPIGTVEHARDLDAESAFRARDATPPLLPPALADVEFGVSRQSVRDLDALARAHGARIAFLFQPYYKGKTAPAEEAWLSQYGPVWKYLAHMDDARFFRDAGHPSDRALPEFNAWLADRIAAITPEDAPRPVLPASPMPE
ncbi:MAG: hypothetical protein ACK4Z7_03905 [Novosphingobium sp.]